MSWLQERIDEWNSLIDDEYHITNASYTSGEQVPMDDQFRLTTHICTSMASIGLAVQLRVEPYKAGPLWIVEVRPRDDLLFDRRLTDLPLWGYSEYTVDILNATIEAATQALARKAEHDRYRRR